MRLREICCDSCPYSPTCEEYNDFLRDIGLVGNEDGDEDGDEDVSPLISLAKVFNYPR